MARMNLAQTSFLILCWHLILKESTVAGIKISSCLTKQNFYEVSLASVINTYVDRSGRGRQFSRFLCGTKLVSQELLYTVHYQGVCQEPECDHCQCIASITRRLWLPSPDNIEVDINCNLAGGSEVCIGECSLKVAQTDEKFNDVVVDPGHPKLLVHKNKRPHMYDSEVKDLFDHFIVNHNRNYRQHEDPETYRSRYEIFYKNLKTSVTLNEAERGTAEYGVTKFMDYSEAEYRRFLAPGFADQMGEMPTVMFDELDANNLHDFVDWRERGAVTPVKNQRQCGSCWAFSTTGNIEGQWFLRHGKLWSLSEQELVDCDGLDDGCNGGFPGNAYRSVERLGGLETEQNYPYAAQDDPCAVDRSLFKVYVNSSVAFPTDETYLAAALMDFGPISTLINAYVMMFYKGGISHPSKNICNPQSLDHAVLFVGYGTENETPYWIIKNSWGTDWGESGYYRIYRGDGSCGVNLQATSAVID